MSEPDISILTGPSSDPNISLPIMDQSSEGLMVTGALDVCNTSLVSVLLSLLLSTLIVIFLKVPVYSSEEVLSIMKLGASNRVVGATDILFCFIYTIIPSISSLILWYFLNSVSQSNEESSRSHAIFLVTIRKYDSIQRV